MSRLRALAGVTTVLVLPMVAIRLLHGLADRPWFRIDWADPSGWLATTSLTDAITALARLAALVVAYWSVVGTIAYLTTVFSGSERLMTRVAPFTFPIVRRMADRAVAGTIAVGVMAAPLIASTHHPLPQAPPPAEPVAEAYVPSIRLAADVPSIPTHGRPNANVPEPVTFAGRPVTSPGDARNGTPERPDPVEEVRPAAVGAGVAEPIVVTGPVDVTVARGEHLWMLAERRLAAVTGRAVADHEVAPYWRATIDENLRRLRSGNPDLIEAGETITLPDPAGFIQPGN